MRWTILAALGLIGCGQPESGFAWDVTVTAAIDECNPDPVPYQETFRYVLTFDGADAKIGIDDEVFASGRLSGCFVDYASVVWSEQHDGAEIRWQLTGSAQFRQGGSTCNLEANVDWIGTETFSIVSSDHPDVPTGCEYVLDASGTYVGQQ